MYKLYFFRALFEVWDGYKLEFKHSNYIVYCQKASDSVILPFEQWVHDTESMLARMVHSNTNFTSPVITLIHAEYITDPVSLDEIPEELNH